MADIEFNRKQKRLRDAIENIGVSLGCEINVSKKALKYFLFKFDFCFQYKILFIDR